MKRVWPFRHIGLKLLSLALAILLWGVVAGQETVERALRVPLELQQFPAGLELVGDVTANVDIRIRGSASAIGRMAPGDLVVLVDLRGARAGRRLFHLDPEEIRVPFGIEVVQITPATVAMTFEASASRSVPVVPDLEGRPAPGLLVGKATADPASVEIVGPESAVKRATEAMTEPVNVAGARDTVVETVNIGLPDAALRLKAPRPATVTVTVVPAPGERILHDRPVHLRGLGPQLTAQADPTLVSVSIRGNRDALARIDPDDVAAFVDLAGLGVGQYSLSLHADSSPDAGVVRIEPAAVQVRIASAR